MSRIDDLIAELCPDGVGFRTLGDVGDFIRGNGLQKSDLTESGFCAIHYGQIHTHYATWTTTTKSFTSDSLAKKLRKAQPGDLVIATTSEDDAAVAKAVAWIGSTEVAVSGDAYIYRHTLEPKYAAYFFQSESFQDQKKRHITGAKVRRVSGESLAKIKIPVPPLEVQREIVKILDTFTELEEELEEELEKRQKQYQYYRDELLSFKDREDINWERLDSLSTITIGEFVHKDNQDPAAPYPVFNGGTTPTGFYNRHNNTGNKIIISARGSAGYVNRISSPYWAGNSCYSIGVLNGAGLNWGFAYHFLKNSETKFIEAQQKGGIPAVSKKQVEQFLMPMPSIEEQDHIVSILDKFDALVNDISSGLPAEIAARRQQYAYYRDKLLSFKEAA